MKLRSDGVPQSWPAWLTVSRVVQTVGALGAACTTAVMSSAEPLPGAARVLLVIFAALVGGRLAGTSSRAPTALRAALATIAAGAALALIFGAFVLPLLVVMTSPPGRDVADQWAPLALHALSFGALAGALVALAYVPVVIAGAAARKNPSLGSVEHVLTRTVRSLGVHVLLHAVLGVPIVESAIRTGDDSLVRFLEIAALAPFCVGAVLFAATISAARERRRWLASVRAGEVPGLGVVDLGVAVRVGGTLPLEHGPRADLCVEAVVRVDEREPDYRTAPEPLEERLVALLPGKEG